MSVSSLELRQRSGAAVNKMRGQICNDDGHSKPGRRRQKEKLNLCSIRRVILSMIVIGTVVMLGVSSLDPEESLNSLLVRSTDDDSKQDHLELDQHYTSMDAEASEFRLPPHLMNEGEVMPFVWKSSGKQVDKYARLIGLPPQLTAEIYDFTLQGGLFDAFRHEIYSNDSQQASKQSQILQGLQTRGKWAVTSPGESSHWQDSNLHWFDGIDEEAFEETLQVLRRGDFDTVLEAIGNEFNCKGLMFAGMGFIAVSHSKGACRHADDPGVRDRFFNVLFPLVLPENDASQLFLVDDLNKDRDAPYNLTMGEAVLMSGDTGHKTGDCDYRENKEMRVAVTIYLADLNDKIAKVIAGDGTALFPVPGNIEWLMKQRGRLWGRGRSLKHDTGRKPYTAKDSNETWCSEQAKAGKCDSDAWEIRPKCPKSCGVYIEDGRYYSQVIGNSHNVVPRALHKAPLQKQERFRP